MNTTAQALIFAIVSVASAAAIGTGLADRGQQGRGDVVKLERVVIVGKRAQADAQVAALRVEHLPRVVIEGRAVQGADVQLASAARAPAL